MRRILLAGPAAAALAVTLAGCASGGAEKSCIADEVKVAPTEASAGDTVQVRGTYVVVCADTNHVSENDRVQQPIERVRITLTDAKGKVVDVTTVKPSTDANGYVARLDTTITVPEGLAPGKATLNANSAHEVTAPLTITD